MRAVDRSHIEASQRQWAAAGASVLAHVLLALVLSVLPSPAPPERPPIELALVQRGDPSKDGGPPASTDLPEAAANPTAGTRK